MSYTTCLGGSSLRLGRWCAHRFAESVLAERFHDAGLDLSFLEETRGNAALTQVLTRYAELQPPTFCSLLNKYLHSRQPAAQVSSLVLLQRILGSSERLLSRLKVSGLLTSLVRSVVAWDCTTSLRSTCGSLSCLRALLGVSCRSPL